MFGWWRTVRVFVFTIDFNCNLSLLKLITLLLDPLEFWNPCILVGLVVPSIDLDRALEIQLPAEVFLKAGIFSYLPHLFFGHWWTLRLLALLIFNAWQFKFFLNFRITFSFILGTILGTAAFNYGWEYIAEVELIAFLFRVAIRTWILGWRWLWASENTWQCLTLNAWRLLLW